MNLVTTYRRNGGELSPFAAFENEVNRLFGTPFAQWGAAAGTGVHVPPTDVREDAEALTVTLDVPGVRPEDVQVSIHEGVLTISGERKEPAETAGYHLRERSSGRFERSFGIRIPVQADAVKAACKDGVLTVTLPKTPEAKPRQVRIEAA